MIPQFPDFKKLEVSDRQQIEKITSAYKPYSDMGFTSLWTWNNNFNQCQIALFGKNLVIKFKAYESDTYFYSFIGTHKINETINALLKFSQDQGLEPQLKLIGEELVAKSKGSSAFEITEDHANHDYILSLKDLANLNGKKFLAKRNLVNQFVKNYEFRFYEIDTFNHKAQLQIQTVFNNWADKKGLKNDTEVYFELKAIKKYFELPPDKSYVSFGIEIEAELRGFMICECLNNEYVQAHFWKCDTSYKGIYMFLLKEAASHFYQQGYQYFNFEQDLGLDQLRQAKMLYRPVGFLRKYTIRPKMPA